MNDTKNISLTTIQEAVLRTVSLEQAQGPSAILEKLPETVKPALITIKRALDQLTELNLLVREGQGRSTGYRLTPYGRLLRPFAVDRYVSEIPDDRTTYKKYQTDVFNTFPKTILSDDVNDHIEVATEKYRDRVATASPVIKEKEMERFVIELSWKSSAIEGNTYTLLDTEKLLREGTPAPGHDPAEAKMILNHKEALAFVVKSEARTSSHSLTKRFIEQIHGLLVSDLGIKTSIRTGMVGITGSAYTPLDNKYQINEALDDLCQAINLLAHPVEKAMLALAGISYIQPFEDGNKRTARLVSNALLLAHDYAPLSYRNVDIESYRSAMLLFYEQISIVSIADIFVNQYFFSTENYLVKTT